MKLISEALENVKFLDAEEDDKSKRIIRLKVYLWKG